MDAADRDEPDPGNGSTESSRQARLDPVEAAGFERLRPKLEGIAYRMTGSAADAQDVAQDAWVRWARVDHAEVEDPEAYLVRITTRLSLDRLRAASRRRETYVGPFLPEPVVAPFGGGEPEPTPEDRAVLADSLTYSFLLLLDELSPIERAVLLLHDVFGYPFAQVAEAVDRSPDAVRQIASRTRRRIADARPGWGDGGDGPATPPDRSNLPTETLTRLVVAVASGDVGALLEVLAPEVVAVSDGGALQRAARRPVVGADRVARVLLWLQRRGDEMGLVAQVVEVNGGSGLALHHADGQPFVVVAGEVDADGRIDRIFLQLNPDKLRTVDPI